MGDIMGLFAKRNIFDLTHERKLTCDMGQLIPILCEEIIPGDTFRVSTDILVRLSPLLAPVMHMINVYTHYFFVPNRLIWEGWQNFITGGEDGNDAQTPPYMVLRMTEGADGPTEGSLADYFGVPIGKDLQISALPMRAYALIWNEWFRDQNLQDALVVQKSEGEDIYAGGTPRAIQRRNWEKDYFTSALPWPQRGIGPTISLGGNVPITVDDPAMDIPLTDSQGFALLKSGSLGNPVNVPNNPDQVSVLNTKATKIQRTLNGNADLGATQMVDINTLRAGFQVQKWMERNARAGVRYIESILAHFGVRSSDARLQRPEFLGGGKSPIVVSEVLQTSETGATSPLGTMAGHGFSAQRSHEFRKSFEEHGFVIGLLSVMPRSNYSQGIQRMWSRKTRYDHYWPEFSHLGEQPVMGKEICFSAAATDEQVFGYQGRYDEYRRRESSIHGAFRSSLNFWHLSREFVGSPLLNSSFVECNPSKRIFAVETEPACMIQLQNKVQAIRPMPLIAEPGLIDHN
jgi:hypothetical protein